jgi:hypothetical protein
MVRWIAFIIVLVVPTPVFAQCLEGNIHRDSMTFFGSIAGYPSVEMVSEMREVIADRFQGDPHHATPRRVVVRVRRRARRAEPARRRFIMGGKIGWTHRCRSMWRFDIPNPDGTRFRRSVGSNRRSARRVLSNKREHLQETGALVG